MRAGNGGTENRKRNIWEKRGEGGERGRAGGGRREKDRRREEGADVK